jgi:hypothetical protein
MGTGPLSELNGQSGDKGGETFVAHPIRRPGISQVKVMGIGTARL